MGLRDGNTSDSTETPVAITECLALGREGVHGIVAASKAYGKRTLGLCLEQGLGLTRVRYTRSWKCRASSTAPCRSYAKNRAGHARNPRDAGTEPVSSAGGSGRR
jgi:hypothetical protein